jgi:hypothetical protein
MRRGPFALTLVILLAAWPSAAQELLPATDTKALTVTVPASLHLAAFLRGSPAGHHLLTWAAGAAGKKALLQTAVSDTRVLDALESLGAKPGDNLSAEAWTERADPANPAPDVRAAGSTLEVTLILPDGTRRPIADLLEDVDKRGVAWKLAGNRKLIPVWKSGCVICLQSCPGSKVANAKATMRDLHKGRARFRPSTLARTLGEGAKVSVELRLVKKSAGTER